MATAVDVELIVLVDVAPAVTESTYPVSTTFPDAAVTVTFTFVPGSTVRL